MKNKVLSFIGPLLASRSIAGHGFTRRTAQQRRLYPPTFFFIIYPPIDLPKI